MKSAIIKYLSILGIVLSITSSISDNNALTVYNDSTSSSLIVGYTVCSDNELWYIDEK